MRICLARPLAVGALLLLALAAPALAAGPAAPTIGWIDAQKILDQTKAGQSIKTRVEAFRDSRQKVIDTDESELKELEDKLGQQTSLLSDDARKEKQAEFQKKLGDYQKKVVQLNRELQDKKDELLKEFNDVLVRAVKKVAAAEGYSYVVDYGGEGSVLYGAPQFDITDKVMAEVDASP
jgi:outer membrane protein